MPTHAPTNNRANHQGVVKYTKTEPCAECPFLTKMNFNRDRLREFAASEFPCHKTADYIEDDEGSDGYIANDDSQHCAGSLIYQEKRNNPNQMTRICERLGLYDRTKLNMAAPVV